jgi:hypothetical protein
MRTTLTLDKDVAAALERLRKSRRASLKQIVNEVMREGLGRVTAPPSGPRRPFRTRALSLGRCRVDNVDDVTEVLAVGEGESFR